tara:strand:+ start:606 stop:971 length:366 start_codon:yes stop_codon:yes gene_type:complete
LIGDYMSDMKIVEVGLCGPGRHPIANDKGEAVENFIFEGQVSNPLDFVSHIKHSTEYLQSVKHDATDALVLYVTGLTPVLTSFLQVWEWTQEIVREQGDKTPQLILMHYDRDSESYVPQHF